MNTPKIGKDETSVNFILWRAALVTIFIPFILFTLLSILWIGQEGRLNNAHIAYFTVSSVASIIAFPISMIIPPKESAERLYCEFTSHFLIAPNFWFSVIIFGSIDNEKFKFTPALTTLSIFILTLLVVWSCTTLIIQGSEKIINSTDKGMEEIAQICKTSIENYIYKYNLQMRIFSLLLLFSIPLRFYLFEDMEKSSEISQYIFGTVGLSFLLCATSEIFAIKKEYNIKSIDGFMDIRNKLREITSQRYIQINEFIHCISPNPRKSKQCKMKNVGYKNCDYCKNLTCS